MKGWLKFLALLTLILSLLCFVFGVFGVHSTYGEVTNTTVPGISDIARGIGLSETIGLVYSYEGSEKLSDAECKNIKSILEDRLFAADITNYKVSYDADSCEFVVELPINSYTAANLSLVYAGLGAEGSLQVFSGFDGKGDVIADNSTLKSATVTSQTLYSGMYMHTMKLVFVGEGKRAIRDYTATGSGNYSVVLDGEVISNRSAGEVVADGVITIGTGTASDSSDASRYLLMALALGGGKLPVALEPTRILDFGAHSTTTGFKVGVAAIAVTMLLAAVAAIVLCGVFGVCALVCELGACGLTVLFANGAFSVDGVVLVSLHMFIGIALGIAAGLGFMISMMVGAKMRMKNLSPYKSMAASFKKVFVSALKVNAVMIVVAAVLRLFVKKAFLLALSDFALGVAAAIICTTIFAVAGCAAVSLAVSSFKKLSSDKLYGVATK